MELDPEIIRSLAAFERGDGSWNDPNAQDLLDLGLIGFEESGQGPMFWITPAGDDALVRYGCS